MGTRNIIVYQTVANNIVRLRPLASNYIVSIMWRLNCCVMRKRLLLVKLLVPYFYLIFFTLQAYNREYKLVWLYFGTEEKVSLRLETADQ